VSGTSTGTISGTVPDTVPQKTAGVTHPAPSSHHSWHSRATRSHGAAPAFIGPGRRDAADTALSPDVAAGAGLGSAVRRFVFVVLASRVAAVRAATARVRGVASALAAGVR
jgi:hypothetical protein